MALNVHLLAFGKYGTRYDVQTPDDPALVEPFRKKTYKEEEFGDTLTHVNCSLNFFNKFRMCSSIVWTLLPAVAAISLLDMLLRMPLRMVNSAAVTLCSSLGIVSLQLTN